MNITKFIENYFQCNTVLNARDLNNIHNKINLILDYIENNEELWDSGGNSSVNNLTSTDPIEVVLAFKGLTEALAVNGLSTGDRQMNGIPSGWLSNYNQVRLLPNLALYMITANKQGNNYLIYEGRNRWKGPYQIGSSNTTNAVGVDTDKYNYIYCRTNYFDFPTVTPLGNAWNPNTYSNWNTIITNVERNKQYSDTTLGITWYDHPLGIDENNIYEWEVAVKRDSPLTNYYYYYGPVCIASWGHIGRDGDGIEYIFYLVGENDNQEITNPNIYFTQGFSGKYRDSDEGSGWSDIVTIEENDISNLENNVDYLKDDFIPIGWHDEPQEVTLNYYLLYVSTRKYKWNGEEGRWGIFSPPKRWNNYSANGLNLTLTNDKIFADDDTDSDGLLYISKTMVLVWDGTKDITYGGETYDKVTVSISISDDNGLSTLIKPCIIKELGSGVNDDSVTIYDGSPGENYTQFDLYGPIDWETECTLPLNSNSFEGFCLSGRNENFNNPSNPEYRDDLMDGMSVNITYTVKLYIGGSVAITLARELSLLVINFSDGEAYSLLVSPNTLKVSRNSNDDSPYFADTLFLISANKAEGKTLTPVVLMDSKPLDGSIGCYIKVKYRDSDGLHDFSQSGTNTILLSYLVENGNTNYNIINCSLNENFNFEENVIRSFEVELYYVYNDSGNEIKVDSETVDFSIKGVKGKDGDGIRGDFKSRVFCRTNLDIGNSNYRPLGGTYDSPLPDPITQNDITWSDGVPNGSESIWSSVRTFYDRNPPAGVSSEWSIPVREADTNDLDIEYNFDSSDVVPGPPLNTTPFSNQHNSNYSVKWYDTSDNPPSGKNWSDAVWRAECKVHNGAYVMKNDSPDWMITKIKGEKGDDSTVPGPNGYNSATVYLYRRSSNVLTRSNLPSSSLYYKFSDRKLYSDNTGSTEATLSDLDDWSRTIPSGTDPCYITQASVSSLSPICLIQSSDWSDPVVFVQNGINGELGKMFYMMGNWDPSTEYKIEGDYIPLVYFHEKEYDKGYWWKLLLNNQVLVSGLNVRYAPGENPTATWNSADSNGVSTLNGSATVTNYKGLSYPWSGNKKNNVINNSYWEKCEQYGVVITEGIFSEFAKLGSAIISGDYMFSQYGKIGDSIKTDIDTVLVDGVTYPAYTFFYPYFTGSSNITIFEGTKTIQIGSLNNTDPNYTIDGLSATRYIEDTGIRIYVGAKLLSSLLNILSSGSNVAFGIGTEPVTGKYVSVLSNTDTSNLNANEYNRFRNLWVNLYAYSNVESSTTLSKVWLTSTNYFSPNWCVDLKTGKMIAGQGNFVVGSYGDITITTGSAERRISIGNGVMDVYNSNNLKGLSIGWDNEGDPYLYIAKVNSAGEVETMSANLNDEDAFVVNGTYLKYKAFKLTYNGLERLMGLNITDNFTNDTFSAPETFYTITNAHDFIPGNEPSGSNVHMYKKYIAAVTQNPPKIYSDNNLDTQVSGDDCRTIRLTNDKKYFDNSTSVNNILTNANAYIADSGQEYYLGSNYNSRSVGSNKIVYSRSIYLFTNGIERIIGIAYYIDESNDNVGRWTDSNGDSGEKLFAKAFIRHGYDSGGTIPTRD